MKRDIRKVAIAKFVFIDKRSCFGNDCGKVDNQHDKRIRGKGIHNRRGKRLLPAKKEYAYQGRRAKENRQNRQPGAGAQRAPQDAFQSIQLDVPPSARFPANYSMKMSTLYNHPASRARG
ncbi:MAG: hypothetical protein FWF49_01160 [Oscillospiraceae bacterium]|nr:hypothetical protein [Oscillospiraceae bacterium]